MRKRPSKDPTEVYLDALGDDTKQRCHVCYALQQLEHGKLSDEKNEKTLRDYLHYILANSISTKGTCSEHCGEMTAAYLQVERWRSK